MDEKARRQEPYRGFEQGPIRPPSEASSLLIRVTRNCPWNRCGFCPVYKGERFSLRPVAHVKADIDAVHRCLQPMLESGPQAGRSELHQRFSAAKPEDPQAFHAALNWYAAGMQSIFLQDANSLILPPEDLIEILAHLTKRFPWAVRITSYARSHTVARIADEHLRAMRAAGLNRIHIGMESGADAVLEMVRKGATQAVHIKAGQKVRGAGMQLSEYVMPGLGGRALTEVHARETAEALNRINPHFIRLRTLAVPNGVPLAEAMRSGRFIKCTDRMMAEEILLMISSLEGITSVVKSDHILNLFEEIDGRLPEDRDRMTAVLNRFLAMHPDEQCRYQVGRRLGLFSRLDQLQSPARRQKVEKICSDLGITADNVDATVDELMKRFI